MAPLSSGSRQDEIVTRLRGLVADLFERVFGRDDDQHPGQPAAPRRISEEKEFVAKGVDSLPDSWRDL